jgi:RNA polymerase sigma-70 factor (ECF subfamily)
MQPYLLNLHLIIIVPRILLKNSSPTYLQETSLILACKQGRREAQNILYKKFGGKMFAVCKRYLTNAMDAEDVLMEGFLKVFLGIRDYNEEGSFEGWMRRIFVNECLMKLRKRKIEFSLADEAILVAEPATILEQLSSEEIQQLIIQLPDGFRTVFNLYAIEGYTHAEIAAQLGISEGTSKSQLSRARVLLQQKIKSNEKE